MAVINTGLLTKGLKSEFFNRFEWIQTYFQDLVTRITSAAIISPDFCRFGTRTNDTASRTLRSSNKGDRTSEPRNNNVLRSASSQRMIPKKRSLSRD